VKTISDKVVRHSLTSVLAVTKKTVRLSYSIFARSASGVTREREGADISDLEWPWTALYSTYVALFHRIR